MKNLMLVFICIISVSQAKSQCDFDSISFMIQLENDTISEIEPVFYEIILRNNSTQPKLIKKAWIDSYVLPLLQYRNELDSTWKSLPLSMAGAFIPHLHVYPENISLKPFDEIRIQTEWINLPFLFGKEFTSNFQNIPDEKQTDDAIIFSLGTYELRLFSTIVETYCKQKLISDTVILVVQEYTGIDKQAKDWLVNNTLYPSFVYQSILREGRVFGQYDNYIYHTQQYLPKNKIEQFIQLFPNSKFTIWAKLYLAQWYYKGFTKIEHYGEYFLNRLSDMDRKKIERLDDLTKADNIIKGIIKNNEHLFNEKFKTVVVRLSAQIEYDIRVIRNREYSKKVIEEYKKQQQQKN